MVGSLESRCNLSIEILLLYRQKSLLDSHADEPVFFFHFYKFAVAAMQCNEQPAPRVTKLGKLVLQTFWSDKIKFNFKSKQIRIFAFFFFSSHLCVLLNNKTLLYSGLFIKLKIGIWQHLQQNQYRTNTLSTNLLNGLPVCLFE